MLPRIIRWIGGWPSIAVAVWRFIVIGVFAFWIGGFTFYGAVVIPMGVEALGSELDFGFITRLVSFWLNISGCVALSLFLVNLIAGWRFTRRDTRWAVLGSWLIMLSLNLVLMVLHPKLDRMLDPSTTSISNRAAFRKIHQVYLVCATVQWAAGLLYLWCTLLTWRRQDRQYSSSENQRA